MIIHAQQKILFKNETKWYEISPKPEGWVKKSFKLYCQIFERILTKVAMNLDGMDESEQSAANMYYSFQASLAKFSKNICLLKN